jgi:hypothetical protein
LALSGNAATLSGWYKYFGEGTSGSNAIIQAIIARWGVNSYSLVYRSDNSNAAVDFEGLSPATSVNAVVSVKDGKWHLITGTYNGANIILYLDGNQVAITAATGNISDGGEDITIGNEAFSGNCTVNGLLDDVRIYNRALSASEVKQLYNAGR